jgi:hypothetical protein
MEGHYTIDHKKIKKEELIVMRPIERISVEAAAVIQGGAQKRSANSSPRDGSDPGQRRW